MMKRNSLYIHYPYCSKHCPYCDFFSMSVHDKKGYSYLAPHLFDDYFVKVASSLKIEDKKWDTLYLGGGSPTLWKGASILPEFVHFNKNYEFTVEVIPGSFDLDFWLNLGVNRFSLGVQAWDDHYLTLLERRDINTIKHDLAKLKGLNVSVDLMLALPPIKKRSLVRELEALLSYSIDHISCYILTLRDGHPWGVVNNEQAEEEYFTVVNFLQKAGFEQYELSNFARQKKYCQHNLNYWQLGEWEAIGPSASAFHHGVHYKWAEDFSMQRDEEHLSAEQLLLERVYLSLRTKWGVTQKLLQQFIQHDQQKEKTIESWLDRNLAYWQNNSLILSSRGFIVMDSLLYQLL